jgi:hypothetical protein
MAVQIRPFALTVPAQTLAVAPVTFPTDLGYYTVSAVSVVLPPGLNGLVGFRFTSGDLAMVPASATDWIIGSGETLEWSMSGQIETGAWQVVAYNTGIYDHTIYVRYFLELETRSAALQVPQVLPVAAIMGGVDGLVAGTPPALTS